MTVQPDHPKAAVTVQMGTIRVAIASTVPTSPDEVWAVVTTFAGVNAELMPYCRMREPRSLRSRTLDSYRPGELAACWLLAGGVIPFDRHLLGLESIDPGTGFVEESTTWMQRRWRHERTLLAVGGTADAPAGTIVEDRLTIEPRWRVAAPATARLVGRIFEHRHRRLQVAFGG